MEGRCASNPPLLLIKRIKGTKVIQFSKEKNFAVDKRPRGAANTKQRSSVDEKVVKEIKNEETIKTSVINNRGVRV